jgi:hypothetical protein
MEKIESIGELVPKFTNCPLMDLFMTSLSMTMDTEYFHVVIGGGSCGTEAMASGEAMKAYDRYCRNCKFHDAHDPQVDVLQTNNHFNPAIKIDFVNGNTSIVEEI